MAGLGNVVKVQFAKQASTTDFSSTPGTLKDLFVVDGVGNFAPRGKDRLERRGANPGNWRVLSALGKKDISPFSFSTEIRGLVTPTGGVTDGTDGLEVGSLFDCFFGADATDTIGAAVTLSSGTSPGIVVSGTSINTGDFVAFVTTDGLQVGQVSAGGGTTTLTLANAYVGTVVAGGTVYRAPKWRYSRSEKAHTHTYFKAEGEEWVQEFFGCTPTKLSMDLAGQTLAKATFEFTPSDVDDTTAAGTPSQPTYTLGKQLYNKSRLKLGNADYCVSDLKLEFENIVTDRPCDFAPNGRHGGIVTDKMVTLTGKMTFGTITALGEFTEALRKTSETAAAGTRLPAAYNTLLQVGDEVGSMLGLRIPNGEAVFKVEKSGAIEMVTFSITAVESASSPFVCELAVF